MNLNKGSHMPSSPKVMIDPADSLATMTECVADCIRSVLPFPVAILVPGKKPLTYNAGNFPIKHLAQIRDHVESSAQALTDRMRTLNQTMDPFRFSDGSCAFFMPLADNRTLEAVLCLYDSSGRGQEPLQEHLRFLQSICHLTAMYLAAARKTEVQAGSEIVSCSTENPQLMVRLVSGLLRTISHDLRTPITTIRGFIKMMLDGRTGPVSEPQRESLQMAFQGVDQLIKIGTSISDASGQIEKIRVEVVDIPALWQSVVDASRPQLLEKSVKIEDSIEGDRRLVCGDRQYLTNLFEQLLACTISVLEPNGKLAVHFRCRNEVTLMLTIPGVSGARTLPVSDEGLASAREIAFLHGGQITLKQAKEGGSILMLVLPGNIE